MFWDRVAWVYDFVEKIYNGKVFKALGEKVAKRITATDCVLECACGTGAISKAIAGKCKHLIATDFSGKMLKRAKKKCKKLNNVEFARANILKLEYPDGVFDKVVAGNVIHLLEEPEVALKELERVCRPGGQIIIPTYINHEKKGKPDFMVRAFSKAGAGFKRQFIFQSYREFLEKAGYAHAEYDVVEGKVPCAIAVITKELV